MQEHHGQELPQGQAGAFEAALDILAQLIGYAVDRIREEEAGQSPRPAQIDLWRRRSDQWAARRRDLSPRDTAAVRAVLEDDAAFLRAVLEGRNP